MRVYRCVSVCVRVCVCVCLWGGYCERVQMRAEILACSLAACICAALALDAGVKVHDDISALSDGGSCSGLPICSVGQYYEVCACMPLCVCVFVFVCACVCVCVCAAHLACASGCICAACAFLTCS